MTEPAALWKVPTGDISDRQIAIMAFVKDYVTAHGWAPTVREIGAAMGIRSTSAVVYNLRKLARLGYIELGGGARMIRLMKQ